MNGGAGAHQEYVARPQASELGGLVSRGAPGNHQGYEDRPRQVALAAAGRHREYGHQDERVRQSDYAALGCYAQRYKGRRLVVRLVSYVFVDAHCSALLLGHLSQSDRPTQCHCTSSAVQSRSSRLGRFAGFHTSSARATLQRNPQGATMPSRNQPKSGRLYRRDQ